MSSDGITWNYHLDAEAAVLSHIYEHPGASDEIAPILYAGSACFYSEANKRIYEAILALEEAGKEVSVVTVTEHLKMHDQLGVVGGSPYVVSVLEYTPDRGAPLEAARIVRDRYRVRQAVAEAQTVSASLRTNPIEAEALQTLLDSTERAFSELGAQHAETTLVHNRDVLAEVQTQLTKAAAEGGVTGTEYGYELVDRKTGGAQKGDVIIVAGRPSHGKTAFTNNVALRMAAREEGVAIFSLEQPAVQIAQRFIAIEGRVDLRLFRTPGKIKPKDWENIAGAMEALSRLPVWIDDRGGLTLADIRRAVRRLRRDIERGRSPVSCKALQLVVIDYLQLARDPTEKYREQEISAISRGCKKLAREEGVAVMLVSQLNRAVEARPSKERRPQLSDLRESGAIEQDADVVLFVHRPEMYEPDDPLKAGYAEIICGKQRQGDLFTVRLAYRGNYVRFDPLEPGAEDLYDPSGSDEDEWEHVADDEHRIRR